MTAHNAELTARSCQRLRNQLAQFSVAHNENALIAPNAYLLLYLQRCGQRFNKRGLIH